MFPLESHLNITIQECVQGFMIETDVDLDLKSILKLSLLYTIKLN
jgi:hypothetical protein